MCSVFINQSFKIYGTLHIATFTKFYFFFLAVSQFGVVWLQVFYMSQNVLHCPHALGVNAADYISVNQQYPWLVPSQNSEFKLTTGRVVGLQSCDIILGNFSETLLALHAMFGV